MMLEASQHEHNSFLTLTYRDEDLPQEYIHPKTGQVYAPNTVRPDHHRSFINSLQVDFKRKTGKTLKYYVCAEYGEKTARPHYHYALFGFPTCTDIDSRKKHKRFTECSCNNCQYLQKKWGKGHIFLGDLTQDSAQYVAGYVTKKLTNENNEHTARILDGRYPEFGRASLKPALGKEAWEAHINKIKRYIHTPEDIPRFLLHNGKKWPIGDYLLLTAKNMLGFNDEEWSLETSRSERAKKDRQNHEKVLTMFEGQKLDEEQKNLISNGLPDVALRLLNSQKVLIIEKRHDYKMHNKKEFA
jgi:hypothetical protein